MNTNDISEFLSYCIVVRNLSPGTVQQYKSHLEAYLRWSGGGLDASSVEAYQTYLHERGLRHGTRQSHLSALRMLAQFLRRRGRSDVVLEDIELGKADARRPKVLGLGEIEALLRSAKKSPRDVALMTLLFSTGLRVSELAALDRDSVAGVSEIAVMGKGRKLRTVYLTARAQAAMQAYLHTRRDRETALFIRTRGGGPRRLSVRSIERMVEKYVAEVGLSTKATPHTFRHSFATDVLGNGANLRAVQELLGHSSIATTEIYTHLTNPELAAAHTKFHSHNS